MTREDLLLLILAGADGVYPMDPVRLMKGAFLATERGKAEWQHLFQFKPYDYGPFDRSVYAARDSLVGAGLVDIEYGRYEECTLSPDGEARADALSDIDAEGADWLRRIGRYVTTRSFSELLEEIYAAYPKYRERSIYNR